MNFINKVMAEREGFEPSDGIKWLRIFRDKHRSATPSNPLQPRHLALDLALGFLLLMPISVMGNDWKMGDEWTYGDVAREATWQAINFVEIRQTIYLSDNPDRFREWCGCMPEHPTHKQVYRWFGAKAVLHLLASHYLPEEVRGPFQYLTIGIAVTDVRHNYLIGLRAEF